MSKRLTIPMLAILTLATIPSITAEADTENLSNVAQPSPPLSAPSQNAASNGVSLRELDALHSQIALLKAQLEIAKLKQGITDAGKTAGAGSAMTGGFPRQLSGMPSPTDFSQNASIPEVLSISGSGSNLSAVLSLPHGGELPVRPGMKVGELVVRSITANGVEVSGKHGVETLPFASGQGSSAQGAQNFQTPLSPSAPFISPISMPSGMPGAPKPIGAVPPSGGIPSPDGGE